MTKQIKAEQLNDDEDEDNASLNESKTYLYKILSAAVKLLKESKVEIDKVIYKENLNKRVSCHRVKEALSKNIREIENVWTVVKDLD